MVGKQTATSKHYCPFSMTLSPNLQKVYFTLESLCRLYQWMAGGAKFKKEKNVHKYCSHPLIKTKKILELVNIPDLHILLGVKGIRYKNFLKD